jgi:hypothetical protein
MHLGHAGLEHWVSRSGFPGGARPTDCVREWHSRHFCGRVGLVNTNDRSGESGQPIQEFGCRRPRCKLLGASRLALWTVSPVPRWNAGTRGLPRHRAVCWGKSHLFRDCTISKQPRYPPPLPKKDLHIRKCAPVLVFGHVGRGET